MVGCVSLRWVLTQVIVADVLTPSLWVSHYISAQLLLAYLEVPPSPTMIPPTLLS